MNNNHVYDMIVVGEGLQIIQTFEPHPLYAVMEGLGYEHHTEQRSEAEFHVWFCRVEKNAGDAGAGKGIYPRCGERRVGQRVRAAGMESGQRFFQQRDRPLCVVSGVQAH